MRRLNRLVVIGSALVAAGLLAGCGGGEQASGSTAPELAARTVEVGEVKAEVTPKRIDDNGAEFAVVLDTHTVELDLDIAASARLVVGGVAWTGATWEGAEPEGHHREGTLRFKPASQAAGTAELTMGGLPEPVKVSWELE